MRHNNCSFVCQNFTQDNKTQGVMEKSQWDLKKIRFKGRRLTRLDDFINTYKDTHKALLREFHDSQRVTKRKERHLTVYFIYL